MTLWPVLTAYCIDVPSMGANCGSPSYVTRAFAAAVCGSITALVGIWAIKTASLAASVPGTDASTWEAGMDSGILPKSEGRYGDAKLHGPSRLPAMNQRPAVR